MKDIWLNVLEAAGMAWWVEITTDSPSCTYYFGPFLNQQEALDSQGGYIEDLELEGATGIGVEVKRCKPKELTIVDEKEKGLLGKLLLAISGQA